MSEGIEDGGIIIGYLFDDEMVGGKGFDNVQRSLLHIAERLRAQEVDIGGLFLRLLYRAYLMKIAVDEGVAFV